MKRFFFVSVFSAALVSTAAPANAQLGWPAPNRGAYSEAQRPSYESRRVAYDNGYREGIKEGEKDARSRDSFEFRDERDWRNGDRGYHRTFGDRGQYQQGFRAGFEAGYADGYRRYAPGWSGGYPPYGNGRNGNGRAVGRRGPGPVYPGYPSQGPGYGYPGGGDGYPGGGYGYGSNPAYNAGVRDGYEKGREDARDRDSYDPLRHKWYREAERDYKREYGSREQYRDLYRQAFREGYERGYRESAYRR